jgi:tetratricopeptide (TPR) repeat protein
MEHARRRRFTCGRWGTALLAAAWITAGGRAWGQATSAPARSVEHAAALVQARAYEQAAAVLRDLLLVDPTNRAAREMLAFDLESMGDLEGERRERASLAAEFPADLRIQADYGRVLERSGEMSAALRAYRRARKLSANRTAPELDAAIERMRGQTALEIGTPLAFLSDPDATASFVQAGAAIPLGSRRHLALLGKRGVAAGRTDPSETASDVLALTFVQGAAGGATWAVGPRLHAVSPRGGGRRDLGVGGAIEGRAPLGPRFEADGRAELETPWDEAAVTVLHGGRTTTAEGHLYSLWFSRRLILQAAAQQRRLSILAADPHSTRRSEAWQSQWVAGADVILWRKPGAAVAGEMLDEALIAPTTQSPAVTLAYRHYDVFSRATSGFAAVIGIVPHGSVDEASAAATMASPGGHIGLELRAGLARDSARPARGWRAGGSLIWAWTPATRFALGYEGADEVAGGPVGRRRTGWLSFHVDL